MIQHTSHFPRGSVDWNSLALFYVWLFIVTSLAEVWIEILTRSMITGFCFRHFPRGSVDWNGFCCAGFLYFPGSLPSRKCGLKFCNGKIKLSLQGHFPCGSVYWNMIKDAGDSPYALSLPSRKCGLKCLCVLRTMFHKSYFPCGNMEDMKLNLLPICYFWGKEPLYAVRNPVNPNPSTQHWERINEKWICWGISKEPWFYSVNRI